MVKREPIEYDAIIKEGRVVGTDFQFQLNVKISTSLYKIDDIENLIYKLDHFCNKKDTWLDTALTTLFKSHVDKRIKLVNSEIQEEN